METLRKALKPMRRWNKGAAAWLTVVTGGALLLTYALGIVFGSPPESRIPKAENGVIDLTEWNWSEEGVVPLDGQWRFDWMNGYDGERSKPTFASTTQEVPKMWEDRMTDQGARLASRGFGVYELKILHRQQSDMMGIRLPNISMSYDLYLDGKLTLSRGHPDVNPKKSVPYQAPATAFFQADDGYTEVRLVVANYDHRQGGIRTSLIMGNSEDIQKLQLRHAAQDFILLGCLLMIGFYHMGLYLLRRKELPNAMFALLCLFVALRMGLLGESAFVQWLDLNWHLSIRLEYFALVMGGWTGMACFRSMYPLEFTMRWYQFSNVSAVLLTAVLIVAEPLQFTSVLLGYQFYILLMCARILFGLVLATHRRREGARLALIGVVGLVVTIINDMLFYNGWWHSVDLLPMGLVFLIVMNSFIISMRFSFTYERVEQMSAQLIEWNSSLEERIEERTEELQRSYLTLEEAKTNLERMEQSRVQLISNISHDLRTPITLLRGYLEALKDDVISEPAHRDKTIRSMLAKVDGLNSLIQDLFDLSVLEAGKVELAREKMTLSWWIDNLREQYGLEMQSKGLVFSCTLTNPSDASAAVNIDIRRMDRVFANLLYNAIRFTPEGGTIRIAMGRSPDGAGVEIQVADSGPGIETADLPYIFDRFYRKDKSRSVASEGSGLGLAIAKEIVELHGGRIDVSNSEEGGSVFRIRLPLAEGESWIVD
ncbi:sensor histidine kinase [Cohnella boryungensis]|uniref:sensor histidine kinase n=1 Tax=Cohnella boryungensis TaxID=768479 RepID=UPI0036727B19